MIQMESILLELQKLPDRYEKVADEAARTEATYRNLSEMSKLILAGLQNSIKRDAPKITESESLRRAMASEEYQLHTDAVCKARHDYLVAEAQHKSLDVRLDCLRSLNSSHTAKIRLL